MALDKVSLDKDHPLLDAGGQGAVGRQIVLARHGTGWGIPTAYPLVVPNPAMENPPDL